jgi:hypothetical protein
MIFNNDIGDAIRKACENDFDNEAIVLTRAAKIVRRDMLQNLQLFQGTFPQDCQNLSVPSLLLAFVNMILYGPSLKKDDSQEKPQKQAALPISQLLAFNSCKQSSDKATTSRHNRDKEYPLPVYLALTIHGETRKKSLIDTFSNMGLCIAYERLMSISTGIANKVISRFEQDGVVCPPTLCTNIFKSAAVDNIDHNPSSTTAQDSFHGTVQHPTNTNKGDDRGITLFDGTGITEKKIAPLPISYHNVPPSALLVIDKLFVPQIKTSLQPSFNQTTQEIEKEHQWLETVKQLVEKEKLDKEDSISWAAFHASKQTQSDYEPAILALLPMFTENAHSVAMILHAMNVITSAIHHVHSGQVPVITLDQPLFAIAKEIQWNWPNTHGENKFVFMLGGLHTEMAALKTLGAWLECSGWTSVIVTAGIASEDVADSLIQVSHIARTRRIHQITAACLYILRYNAYTKYLESLAEQTESMSFDNWINVKSKEHPQIHYWNQVLTMELCVFQLVRSIREGNFKLYKESLEQISPWMFALDRVNYARWLSVHIRDMHALPDQHPDIDQQFNNGAFVVHKSKKVFSSIALDHAHEQMNALIKGDGGAVGLTESPGALRRWIIAGPEIARMIKEFENSVQSSRAKDNLLHHEQQPGVQASFRDDVASLISTFEELGNPFEEESEDLLVLDSKDIVNKEVVKSVNDALAIRKEQYKTFVKERFETRKIPINEPIKKNKLPLFSTPKAKSQSKQAAKLAILKTDCALFSRLYIACQIRDGNLEDFFKHENQTWPPSLQRWVN